MSDCPACGKHQRARRLTILADVASTILRGRAQWHQCSVGLCPKATPGTLPHHSRVSCQRLSTCGRISYSGRTERMVSPTLSIAAPTRGRWRSRLRGCRAVAGSASRDDRNGAGQAESGAPATGLPSDGSGRHCKRALLMRRHRVGGRTNLQEHALLHRRHRRGIRVIFQSVQLGFVATRHSGRNRTFRSGLDLMIVVSPNGLLNHQLTYGTMHPSREGARRVSN